MNHFTRLNVITVCAALTVATTALAQQPYQKAEPHELIPFRVKTPLKMNPANYNQELRGAKFSKVASMKVKTQQTELVNEDFSRFTEGSIDKPDTTNWIVNSWKGTSNEIPSSKTNQPGWTGNFLGQAGGAAALCPPGPEYMTPAFICTPPQDYSGSVTVTFRVMRWPGYEGNITINGYVANGEGNSYGSDEGTSETFQILGSDTGWQYYTWTFDCHHADPDMRIWFNTYNWIIIDDINVKVSPDKFIAEPKIKPLTNITDSTFTANWETVRAADTYLVGLQQKVWTSDVDSANYYYDFEDGVIPDGFSTTGTIIDTAGINGSKAITIAPNDTITFPSNNATYKKAEVYMRVIGPENASANDLNAAMICLMAKSGDTWTENGYYRPSAYFTNPKSVNLLTSRWSDDSNKYTALRFVLINFPEGYKLALDSIAIVTNRPYGYKMINEPGNWTTYNDDYTESTDWFVSTSLTSPHTSFTFEGLDPSSEYFYAVIARRGEVNSTYTWYHAFGLPAPVATEATNASPEGSYTANWKGTVKATRYTVTNYGVHVAASDQQNYPLIDEDFSLFDSNITSATDPKSPQSINNYYQVLFFDGYTKLKGWRGISNAMAQGYLGCTQVSYYTPYLGTPVFQADNDTIVTVSIKAIGTPGDLLTLTFPSGNTYAVQFDESGNLDVTDNIPESDKEMSIRINSYGQEQFMIDRITVMQNLKAGATLFTPLESATVGADTLSYTFKGLTNDFDHYAFDVVALQDLDGETAQSEPSGKVILLLDPTGIKDLKASNKTGFAKVVGRYSIDGRKVSKDYKGIQILKLSDGSSVKAIVK